MKTAISVPDEIFERTAGSRAGHQPIGILRRAARRYLDELAARSLTSQIDQALLAAGDDDSARPRPRPGAAACGRGDDDW